MPRIEISSPITASSRRCSWACSYASSRRCGCMRLERKCLQQVFIAVLPLVLFLYLVQTTERTQVFFLGRIHTFRIPQKESYIVTESERAPEMSIKECEMRNTSRRIVEAKRFVQFMAVPYSSPKGLIKSVAELTSMYTSKQLVVSNSKDPSFRIRSPPHDGILFGKRGLGFCKQLANATSFHVTMLRDPLERIAASFRQIKLNYGIPGVSLDEAAQLYKNSTLRKKRVVKEISPFWMLLNQQVDYMCGFECIEAITSGPLRGVAKDRYLRLSSSERLSRALQNLKSVDAVGVYGKTDEFVQQLGFYVPALGRYVERKEVASGPIHRLSSASAKILKKLLRYEYRLYNAAVERAKSLTRIAVACKRHQSS